MLKGYETPLGKIVMILPDMTPLQLEQNKKLNDEMWRRRNGGENVYIMRGKIVASNRSGPSQNDH